MKKIIETRKEYKAFSRGNIEFLRPKNHKILAYIRSYEEEKILCIVNLSKKSEFVELDLSKYDGSGLVEIFDKSIFPQVCGDKYVFTMQGHSFFWFEMI